jgi:hypothetical protein
VDRHRAVVWTATIIFAVGLAALVPCAFALSAYGTGSPYALRLGQFVRSDASLGMGFLIASFVAGLVAYRHAVIWSNAVLRWVAVVAAAVGGTVLLSSLWVVVLGIVIAGPNSSAVLVPVLAFVVGATKAGLEGFLLTGLWTALVLSGDRIVSRRASAGAERLDGAKLFPPVIVFWLCGGLALCFSLPTINRLAAGLTRLASDIAARVM